MLDKFFCFFPFLFAKLIKKFKSLKPLQKSVVFLPVCVVFGGFLVSPFMAVLVGFLYFMGFIGLLLILGSVKAVHPLNWMYLVLGFILVVLCWLWLELAYYFVPFG